VCLGVYVISWSVGLYNVCHADNHVEVNSLVTPFHIIPEWYFLWLYTVLKVVPQKLLGLMCFLVWLMIMCNVCESRNVCSICRVVSVMCDNVMCVYLMSVIICVVLCGLCMCVDMYVCMGRVFVCLVSMFVWVVLCSSRVYVLSVIS
jgi:quinol-cytochrome oxidoreductase complex cytochrome b subunit